MKYIGTEKQLIDYGFEYNSDYESGDLDWELSNAWVYCIGHSRRGQFYYLITNLNSEIYVYASRPDGSGTYIELPEILKKMMEDGVIE
jgi:hypothetical protein